MGHFAVALLALQRPALLDRFGMNTFTPHLDPLIFMAVLAHLFHRLQWLAKPRLGRVGLAHLGRLGIAPVAIVAIDPGAKMDILFQLLP